MMLLSRDPQMGGTPMGGQGSPGNGSEDSIKRNSRILLEVVLLVLGLCVISTFLFHRFVYAKRRYPRNATVNQSTTPGAIVRAISVARPCTHRRSRRSYPSQTSSDPPLRHPAMAYMGSRVLRGTRHRYSDEALKEPLPLYDPEGGPPSYQEIAVEPPPMTVLGPPPPAVVQAPVVGRNLESD
ncbi:hypothetical protein FA15DRAFT_760909 [Coprinopsis marcescibilis]|uniref:Uncharacterized protein n=1 Tax=Coprinopsis marcescibilis TaxID=230819 RepID=A0A5C3KDJ5_COPMA|nr:hypothetical protein FA15DRAFT_760909 [Coprinopsis marcescibilis]